MKEEEIDGKALLHSSAADLKELGVYPKHRSQLLARIQDLPRTSIQGLRSELRGGLRRRKVYSKLTQ